MIQASYYLADRAVAERCGDLGNAYVTSDGKYIISSRHLKRVRLSPSEYVTGLKGLEEIPVNTALRLIAENGYKKGNPSGTSIIDGVRYSPIRTEEPHVEEDFISEGVDVPEVVGSEQQEYVGEDSELQEYTEDNVEPNNIEL